MRVRGFPLLAVVAALELLAAACGGGGERRASVSTPPAACGQGSELSQEQAIQCAVWIAGADPDNRVDPSTATARRMMECKALDLIGWEGVPRGRPPRPPAENPVWLVEVRGEFSGFVGYGLTPDPSPPLSGRFVQVLGDGGAGAILFDEREREGPELSREKIIERALLEIDIPENEAEGGTATAGRTTYGDALASVQQEGAPEDIIPGQQSDAPVWLVEVRGDFADPCDAASVPGKYLLILALDGLVESSGFIPDATATP